MTTIQVAGIHDLEEANLVLSFNISCLGFPLRLAHHKPDLSEASAKKVISLLKSDVDTVLITYLDKASDIETLASYLVVKSVQLHGDVHLEEVQQLRRASPILTITKSLIVRGNNLSELISTVDEYTPYVDGFITDTFDPETGACGATGKTHDWVVSEKLVSHSQKPLILAGGLNSQNVYEAIIKVKPAGVDVHTGVENHQGRKDSELLKRFVQEAKRAFSDLGHSH